MLELDPRGGRLVVGVPLANLLQGVGLTTTVVVVPPEEDDPSSLAASSEHLDLIPRHIHLIHVTPGLPADAPVEEIPAAVRSNLERYYP